MILIQQAERVQSLLRKSVWKYMGRSDHHRIRDRDCATGHWRWRVTPAILRIRKTGDASARRWAIAGVVLTVLAVGVMTGATFVG